MSHTIDQEFLKTCQKVKAPLKYKTVFYTVNEYMRNHGLDGRDLSSCGHGNYSLEDKLNADTYAKEVTIVSSGNEPKVYAYVYDNHEKYLYFACYLDNTPEAYALVAKYAGMFMEMFNDYMSFIDGK